jgi:hypothetical protein
MKESTYSGCSSAARGRIASTGRESHCSVERFDAAARAGFELLEEEDLEVS